MPGSTFTVAPRSGTSRISLEDRAFDASGSILVPHASLEAMLAQASGQHPAGEAVTLFQRLATMAGTLLRAAGLTELLESVMGLVTSQIPCQRGFILLADAGGELVPELVWEEQPGQNPNPISRTIARTAMKDRVAILTTDARMDPRFSAGESIKIHGITSALCAPLIVENQALGVIYLETSLSKGSFKREDEHLLSAMANFAAVGIQREREAKFRQRLERYHSPAVVDQILKSSQNKEAPALQAQRCQISVLFADISGFTRMSEGMEPLVLAGILNRTFEAMTDQIFSRGGTLDKYIGDAIMAFFGAPTPDPDHAKNAVEAGFGGALLYTADGPDQLPAGTLGGVPAGVNLRAFDSRLLSTCSTRRESPMAHASFTPKSMVKARPRFATSGANAAARRCSKALKSKRSRAICSSPASTLEMSRTSLIKARRWREEFLTKPSCFSCSAFSGPGSFWRRMPVKPMIELSGVRSSCDIVARKADLTRSAASARALATSSSAVRSATRCSSSAACFCSSS